MSENCTRGKGGVNCLLLFCWPDSNVNRGSSGLGSGLRRCSPEDDPRIKSEGRLRRAAGAAGGVPLKPVQYCNCFRKTLMRVAESDVRELQPARTRMQFLLLFCWS